MYSLETPPLGNILTETFASIKAKPELLKIIAAAKEGALKECGNCEIKNICGGGCYRSSSLDGKNAFCETFKSLYPYIEKVVRSFSKKCRGVIELHLIYLEPMSSMGYNRAKTIMSNGERILVSMNGLYDSKKIECKDYPVWDGDRYDESWSSDSWQDSHRNQIVNFKCLHDIYNTQSQN